MKSPMSVEINAVVRRYMNFLLNIANHLSHLVHYPHAIVVSNQKCMFSRAQQPLLMQHKPSANRRWDEIKSNARLARSRSFTSSLGTFLMFEWIRIICKTWIDIRQPQCTLSIFRWSRIFRLKISLTRRRIRIGAQLAGWTSKWMKIWRQNILCR